MERLNFHLVNELSKRFDVHVIAPKGASQHVVDSSMVTEITLRPVSRFLFGAMFKAIIKARKWQPNIIIAGSGLTAPIAFFTAKVCGAKCYAYVHGLDLAFDHIVYRLIWRPILRSLDGVIANSRATAEIGEKIGISENRITIVHPGVAIPATINRSVGEHFRKKYGLGGGAILLSVGRLTARKGLREFVQDVMPRVLVHRPDVQLVVVGDEPTDSLYAEGQSVESIKELALCLQIERNIHFLGKKFGDELSEAFLSAAVHVFPVRSIIGDPEGFGMVAIEAAAYGVPTVAYSTGGVTDSVADGASGYLVKPGDVNAFVESTLKLIDDPLPFSQVRKFAEQFAWGQFGKKISAAINCNRSRSGE